MLAAMGQGNVESSFLIPIFDGILRAMQADYSAGYLLSLTQLVHADVFSDFLEMADYLLNEGFKDPAAVLAGGVLESRLRNLCDVGGLSHTDANGVPKKADLLNSELAKSQAYSKLDQKSITAWLDLRNKAAHGHYDGYTAPQVALMVQGIRDFLTRVLG
jgi:hypothetical protein